MLHEPNWSEFLTKIKKAMGVNFTSYTWLAKDVPEALRRIPNRNTYMCADDYPPNTKLTYHIPN